jgi:hypothetical protein
VQLELPPFSQFSPSLMLWLTFGLTAAWAWSLWLLITGWDRLRGLPAWQWAVALIVAPIVSAPAFLVFGAPADSSRVRRVAATALLAGVVVTEVVVAIQQIGITDCQVVRVAHHGATGVCWMEARSDSLPVLLGILAAVIVGILVLRPWHTARSPEPLAT